eukprot:CAMPEP_0185703984 /NCGR_PEP_ID=MMETSP1164-20130828/15990_1 /TAXON_ID=1104430 /ORGANISM="Chrysoreinhardia sp, Strain CCMP2950" /LENGTH=30 /DNA_ID= /DNA_START= /DNA_END= /DNA_ORIENTATION=
MLFSKVEASPTRLGLSGSRVEDAAARGVDD